MSHLEETRTRKAERSRRRASLFGPMSVSLATELSAPCQAPHDRDREVMVMRMGHVVEDLRRTERSRLADVRALLEQRRFLGMQFDEFSSRTATLRTQARELRPLLEDITALVKKTQIETDQLADEAHTLQAEVDHLKMKEELSRPSLEERHLHDTKLAVLMYNLKEELAREEAELAAVEKELADVEEEVCRLNHLLESKQDYNEEIRCNNCEAEQIREEVDKLKKEEAEMAEGNQMLWDSIEWQLQQNSTKTPHDFGRKTGGFQFGNTVRYAGRALTGFWNSIPANGSLDDLECEDSRKKQFSQLVLSVGKEKLMNLSQKKAKHHGRRPSRSGSISSWKGGWMKQETERDDASSAKDVARNSYGRLWQKFGRRMSTSIVSESSTCQGSHPERHRRISLSSVESDGEACDGIFPFSSPNDSVAGVPFDGTGSNSLKGITSTGLFARNGEELIDLRAEQENMDAKEGQQRGQATVGVEMPNLQFVHRALQRVNSLKKGQLYGSSHRRCHEMEHQPTDRSGENEEQRIKLAVGRSGMLNSLMQPFQKNMSKEKHQEG